MSHRLPDPEEAGHPFRKKPVVIWAVKMRYDFTVKTLEGIHQGHAGDYLIKGVKGELYPCRADIFEETYEPA